MGTLGVVFDTNVLVSALGFGGTPLEAVLGAVRSDCEIVASADTLAELSRVMTYDRLPFTDTDRDQYLTVLQREATLVDPNVDFNVIEVDPDDDAFLECAVTADADFVVSGDDHLLALGTFRDIEIVTPAEFIEHIQ